MSLRPYQQKAIDDLRAAAARGLRAPVLVMPTGGGKTLCAKAIIESAAQKGRSALFLAPRRELIYQASEKLDAAGVRHGIIMAGERPKLLAGVQVASVPTLYRRMEHMDLPAADVVIVDECHLAISRTTRAVLDAYPNAVKIGLTATPCRGDGRGLGEVFDGLVIGPTIPELIQQGHLVPTRYFAGKRPDLTGVKIQAGDYNPAQLGDRMDRVELIGDVVSNWLRLASDRPTFVFAVNIAHSMHLRDRFAAAGVSVAHLDKDTHREERRQMLRDLGNGRLQVVVNVDVATYGIDIPAVSCIVLARPTKSLVRYMQSIGRALRPSPGKADCIVLDGACNIDEHGFVDDPKDWTLAGKSAKEATKPAPRERRETTCPACGAVYRSSRICVNCGHEPPARTPRAIAAIESDLFEVTRAKKRKNREWAPEAKEQFYSELRGYAKAKGYADGWSAHKYKERFGVWPNAHSHVSAQVPGAETLAWITHLNILSAKRRSKWGA